MTAHAHRHNRPVNDALHPLVYRTMIALTVWLVLSIWVLFDRGGYVGLAFAMVTLFFVVIVAIPLLLWLAWRKAADPRDLPHDTNAFRDWAAHDFATWTGDLSGREAAMQILLPLAAVSIGMTIFGLVFVLTVPAAGS